MSLLYLHNGATCTHITVPYNGKQTQNYMLVNDYYIENYIDILFVTLQYQNYNEIDLTPHSISFPSFE